ncbi:unnamed protein product, partial [Symbiodinium sp. CCMP2456]
EPCTPPPGWKPTPKEPSTPPPGWRKPAPTEAVSVAPNFLFGARGALKSLPYEVRSVPVNDIEFTQDSCADVFGDGRRCEDTFRQLLRGDIRPDVLQLDIVESLSSGQLASFNNRRLRVLKQLQDHHPGKTLYATCRVRTMQPDFESVMEQLYDLRYKVDKDVFDQQKELFQKCLFHRDTEYRGDIRVRTSKRRPQWWS